MKIEGEAELQGKAEGEREGEEEGEEEKEEEGEKEGEEEGQAEGETEEEGDNHDLLFLLASQKDGTPQMNRTFRHLWQCFVQLELQGLSWYLWSRTVL